MSNAHLFSSFSRTISLYISFFLACARCARTHGLGTLPLASLSTHTACLPPLIRILNHHLPPTTCHLPPPTCHCTPIACAPLLTRTLTRTLTPQWADGRYYEGGFEENRKHGRGLHRWADGETYEGDYVNDVRHGQGTYKYADGQVRGRVGMWGRGEKKQKKTTEPHPFPRASPSPTNLPLGLPLPLNLN